MPMTIIEDTRQQVGQHKLKLEYFERKGISVVRSKLPAGDYALLTDMSRVVDTKQDLQEVYSNLIQQHERFRREADFCKDNGIKLTILVEEPGIYRLDDVRRWKNPRMQRYEKIKSMHNQGKWKKIPEKKPPVNGEQLWKIMYTFAERHGVMWRFTSPQNAGRAVMYLLTGEDYGK